MRKLLSALLLCLATVSVASAQHHVTLSWQLPTVNATWTTPCGATPYQCVFNIYRDQVASPTTPCASGDLALMRQSGAFLAQSEANATSFEDDTPVQGGSYCYGVSTVQGGSESVLAFLTSSSTGPGAPAPAPVTVYTGLSYYPITPCRVVDTRGGSGPLAGPAMQGNTERDFPLLSSNCNIPATVQAYELNVTVIAVGSSLNYATIWATGTPQPSTSLLNDLIGTTLANSNIVAAGTNGSVSMFVSDNANVIIDCIGYFAP